MCSLLFIFKQQKWNLIYYKFAVVFWTGWRSYTVTFKSQEYKYPPKHLYWKCKQQSKPKCLLSRHSVLHVTQDTVGVCNDEEAWTPVFQGSWSYKNDFFFFKQVNYDKVYQMHACMLSLVQLFVTLWAVAHQAPLSMEFSRQEYWKGLSFPPSGDLPNPGLNPSSLASPALAGRYFTNCTTWKAHQVYEKYALHVYPDEEKDKTAKLHEGPNCGIVNKCARFKTLNSMVG